MVGRKREIEMLKAAYASDDAEFVGVYGRRRVGKTYLISQTFAGKFIFQHSGLSPYEEESPEKENPKEGEMARQLRHFQPYLIWSKRSTQKLFDGKSHFFISAASSKKKAGILPR